MSLFVSKFHLSHAYPHHSGTTLSSMTSLARDQYPLLLCHKVVIVVGVEVSRPLFEAASSSMALTMRRNRESVIDTMAHKKLRQSGGVSDAGLVWWVLEGTH